MKSSTSKDARWLKPMHAR